MTDMNDIIIIKYNNNDMNDKKVHKMKLYVKLALFLYWIAKTVFISVHNICTCHNFINNYGILK